MKQNMNLQHNEKRAWIGLLVFRYGRLKAEMITLKNTEIYSGYVKIHSNE